MRDRDFEVENRKPDWYDLMEVVAMPDGPDLKSRIARFSKKDAQRVSAKLAIAVYDSEGIEGNA